MVLTQRITSALESAGSSVQFIPLWFSRNRFYYEDIIQVFGRQNQINGKIFKATSNLTFIDFLELHLRWTHWLLIEKALVFSKKHKLLEILARYPSEQVYRIKQLSISLSIKWPIASRIYVNWTRMILNRPRSVIWNWVQRKMVDDRSDENQLQNY